MKLIFAILDVSLTMGLTRFYKTECFHIYMHIDPNKCLKTKDIFVYIINT